MPAKRYLNEEEQDLLREAFYSNLGVTAVGKDLKISYNVIMRYWREWFSLEELRARCSRLNRLHKTGTKNPMYGKCKEEHHNYIGGKITTQGYRQIKAPEWYQGSTDCGQALEHLIVYCDNNRLFKIPEGYVVHHIDEDKLNNSIDNLEMMTRSDHSELRQRTCND